MAISIANKTFGTDVDGNSTATTASTTPAANKLQILTVRSRTGITANPNQPTITGNSLTWVAINSIVYDTAGSSRKRITTFRALGSSPTAGTLAIDFGGQNQTSVGWILDEATGMDVSGTDGSGAIVQSATNKDETVSTGTLTVTLAAFSSTDNATYGAFAEGGNGTWTAGSGFTELASVADATDLIDLLTEYKATNDTSVDATDSANSELGGIAFEIKAAAMVPDAVSNSGVKAAVSSITWSHTCSGSNRLLVVTTETRDSGNTSDFVITGITYNSVAMTNAVSQEYPNDAYLRTEIWYLPAPATGANNIVVTYTGTVDHATAGAVSFTGAAQTSIVDASGGAEDDAVSATDPSVSITTTTAGCYVVDSVYDKSATAMVAGSGQVQMYQLGPNGDGDKSGASYKFAAATGSVTMSWAESADDDWATCAAAFRPFVAATSTFPGYYGSTLGWM